MHVLLTHGEGRLEGLDCALASAGFTVTHTPLIRTELLPAAALKEQASALLSTDWLLFTSRTAVSAWAALELPLGGINPQIGVVGERTRAALMALGAEVALTAQPANAQGLLEAFLARVTGPAAIGLPSAEDALPTLPEGLAQAGFEVEQVALYRTVQQPISHLGADIVVLASPSAVAALPEVIPATTRFVALGPSTHEALTRRGLNALESSAPDVDSVVQAVLQVAAGAVELEAS